MLAETIHFRVLEYSAAQRRCHYQHALDACRRRYIVIASAKQCTHATRQHLIVVSYLLRVLLTVRSILAVHGWAGGVRGRQVKVMQIARLLTLARIPGWGISGNRGMWGSSIIYSHLRRQALFEHRTTSGRWLTDWLQRLLAFLAQLCLSTCLSVRPSVRLSVCLSVCLSAGERWANVTLSQPYNLPPIQPSAINFCQVPTCHLSLRSFSTRITAP